MPSGEPSASTVDGTQDTVVTNAAKLNVVRLHRLVKLQDVTLSLESVNLSQLALVESAMVGVNVSMVTALLVQPTASVNKSMLSSHLHHMVHVVLDHK